MFRSVQVRILHYIWYSCCNQCHYLIMVLIINCYSLWSTCLLCWPDRRVKGKCGRTSFKSFMLALISYFLLQFILVPLLVWRLSQPLSVPLLTHLTVLSIHLLTPTPGFGPALPLLQLHSTSYFLFHSHDTHSHPDFSTFFPMSQVSPCLPNRDSVYVPKIYI